MDETERRLLGEMNKSLEQLLSGKKADVIPAADDGDPALLDVARNLNLVIQYVQEADMLSKELAQGKLYGKPPGRSNILASPLKQLQSQLEILNYNIKQLLKGKIVNKINMDGDLMVSFNELVERVANASTTADDSGFAMIDSEEQKMNSWRYHQILLAVNMLDIKVIEVDANGKVVYANRPGKALLGEMDHLTPEKLTEDTDELIEHMVEHSSGDKGFPVVKEIYDENRILWYRITSDTFVLANDQRFYLHVVDDITDWKVNEKRLEHTANMDALTGTFSRRAGLNMLRTLNDHPSEITNCLIFIDIDGLKVINDTYGHNEGDEYIRAIADLLLTSFRSSEAVVRYGGDEFFVLLKNCTSEVVEKVLDRVDAKLNRLNESGAKPYKMSFSYGAEMFGNMELRSVDEILEAADQKMYEDKTRKKNAG